MGMEAVTDLSRKFHDPRGRDDEITVKSQLTHFRQTIHSEAIFFIMIRGLAPRATQCDDFLHQLDQKQETRQNRSKEDSVEGRHQHHRQVSRERMNSRA